MNQVMQNSNLILVIKCPERNKTYNIETEKATLVEELCSELADALGCSEQQEIRLFRDEVELDRRQTFGQLGIQKGCQLEAKIRANDQQKKGNVGVKDQNQNQNQLINVRINSQELNKNYAMQVDPNQKVQNLMQQLNNQIGGQGQRNQIQLSSGNVALDPNRTLREQNVPDQAQLELRVNRVGG